MLAERRWKARGRLTLLLLAVDINPCRVWGRVAQPGSWEGGRNAVARVTKCQPSVLNQQNPSSSTPLPRHPLPQSLRTSVSESPGAHTGQNRGVQTALARTSTAVGLVVESGLRDGPIPVLKPATVGLQRSRTEAPEEPRGGLSLDSCLPSRAWGRAVHSRDEW